MAEGFQKLVEGLQAEIASLRLQVSSGRPTVAKDLSLISQVPRWAGTEKSVSVDEFFELVESVARIGNWSEADQKQAAILKLTDAARAFYSSNPDLHSHTISWGEFKNKFQQRFREVRCDQYLFGRLQRARQQKDEDPQSFLDRCRSLAMKTVPKVEDEQQQKFHYDQAERLLLSTFVGGLLGNPGQQVRFQMPPTVGAALRIAMTVYEAERQEKRDAAFLSPTTKFSKCEARARNGQPWTASARPDRASAVRGRADTRAAVGGPSQLRAGQANANRDGRLLCYRCQRPGHFARNCSSNQPNRGGASGNSRLFHRQATSRTQETRGGTVLRPKLLVESLSIRETCERWGA
jgi:hypothetical protein